MKLDENTINNTVLKMASDCTDWIEEDMFEDGASENTDYYCGYVKGILELGNELKKILDEEVN